MTQEGSEGEKTGKEVVIESLVNNPENLAPLHEWLAAREAACRNGMDNLRLTVELLDIYIAGGEPFRDNAWDTLDAAHTQAEGEGSDDVYHELLASEAVLRGE